MYRRKYRGGATPLSQRSLWSEPIRYWSNLANSCLKNRKGFTLAEVLITLGIIGIIAAITIPTLISKYQERATVNKLTETYSILSQAVKLATIEYGNIDSWCDFGGADTYDTCSVKVANNIFKYVKKNKECYGTAYYYKDACFAAKYTNRFTDSFWVPQTHSYPTFMLINGVAVAYKSGNGDGYTSLWCKTNVNVNNSSAMQNYSWWSYMGSCGAFYVDINGAAGPNQDGRDYFIFRLYNDGIAPNGRKGHGNGAHYTESFEKNCMGQNYSSFGTCTAWVIENKNMDYLHCDDLSWDGKHKCSD